MKMHFLLLAAYVIVLPVGAYLAHKEKQDGPRADMYLPGRLLAMAVAFLAASGAAYIWFGTVQGKPVAGAVTAVLLILLSIAAFMCWKNQKIRIVSDTEFVYTTFLGTENRYRFDDIVGMRKNRDSLTLVMKTGSVHVESMAVLSAELVEKINAQLAAGQQAE